MARKQGSNLKKIRLSEGLAKAELARLAEVSIPTITDAEEGRRGIREVTKYKILNGLNKNPNRKGKRKLEDIFP